MVAILKDGVIKGKKQRFLNVHHSFSETSAIGGTENRSATSSIRYSTVIWL